MKLTYVAPIDAGGMGDVWLAKDELDRYVAVKAIREDHAMYSDAQQHGKVLSNARHKGVVTIHAYEETVDHPHTGEKVAAIVMEYLDGITLHDRFSQGLLAEHEVARLSLGRVCKTGPTFA